MTILLINANPVVSRLFTLCTRDDDVFLETVLNVDDANEHRYDVLFIDEASCKGDIAFLSTRLDVGKKVYLSYSDEPVAGFEEIIKKPFLPSQITDVLKRVEVREPIEIEKIDIPEEHKREATELEEEYHEDAPSIFPLSPASDEDDECENHTEMSREVLDRNEIERIKSLLDMEEEETQEVEMSEENYESRKIEVIKEQLIADGLEIFEEEEIVDVLHEANASKVERQSKKNKKYRPKKKSKDGQFTQDEWAQMEDAFEVAVYKLKPKKVKKLLKGKEIEITIKLEDEK